MLDRFKVPKEDQIRISQDSLRASVTAIFKKMGLESEDAANGADVLVTADLRGIETHGVSNKMADYVRMYTSNEINPRPEWRIVRESPGTAVIDGDRGLGIILGNKAMSLAIEKARSVGVGIVTIYNSAHLGAVGHFSMQAANEGMVGMCGTALGLGIHPWSGAEAGDKSYIHRGSGRRRTASAVRRCNISRGRQQTPASGPRWGRSSPWMGRIQRRHAYYGKRPSSRARRIPHATHRRHSRAGLT